jgi:hypothetical protein
VNSTAKSRDGPPHRDYPTLTRVSPPFNYIAPPVFTTSHFEDGNSIREPRLEAAEVDPARTRTAAGLDDALAAVEGGASVVAVMTGNVMPV